MLGAVDIWPYIRQPTIPLCNCQICTHLAVLPLTFVALQHTVEPVRAAEDVYLVLAHQMQRVNLVAQRGL